MAYTFHKLSFLIRTAVMAGSAVFISALPAQTPAWFPLEVGNTWLYRGATSNPRAAGLEPRSISVHGKETAGSREYFNVSYFGREVLLRVEPADGSVIEYDRGSNTERPWLNLGLPVGSTFPTRIDDCVTNGTIAARDATVVTPAGTFTSAVQVRYQTNCADAGVTQQFYAANVGLLSSEETTFAGPIKYELSYFRVGSTTGGAKETSFTLALDSPRYPVGATLVARLTLRSTSPDPIRLFFPSGQSFDLKILDEKGNAVFVWSAARLFPLIIRDEMFGPGEKTYGLTAPLDGIAPGRYMAQAFLTTNPPMYQAEVSFEIVP